MGPLVSIFFFLSALFHFLVVSPWFKDIYLAGLRDGRNTFRWIEYAISSSVMIWLIAMFFGVADIALLMCIFVMNAVMNLCGMLMERANKGERAKTGHDSGDPLESVPFQAGEGGNSSVYKTDETPVDWLPFILGTMLGAMTWVAIFTYFFGSGPSSEIPGFVYGILFSYLLFFNTFPINMVLVYKRVGRWKDYMFGEFVYIVLSLGSKTLLGWLVFGGINQPNKYTA